MTSADIWAAHERGNNVILADFHMAIEQISTPFHHYSQIHLFSLVIPTGIEQRDTITYQSFHLSFVAH